MKRSTFFSFLLIGLVTIAATGCKKTGVGITPIPGRDRIPSTGIRSDKLDGGLTYTAPDEGTWRENEGLEGSPKPMNSGDQLREPLQAETIYFDLDSSTIKSGEQSKLQRVADYLIANPSHDVLIEGHADERGTEGYNQSLGERRALATREALATIGAPANRIYTTSYGESRPAAQGSGESAWKQNRRAEFVVVLPAQ